MERRRRDADLLAEQRPQARDTPDPSPHPPAVTLRPSKPPVNEKFEEFAPSRPAACRKSRQDGRYGTYETDCCGEYQIGDDQARSWIVAGSPSGIAIPSRAASRVLQRGVGISSTRA